MACQAAGGDGEHIGSNAEQVYSFLKLWHAEPGLVFSQALEKLTEQGFDIVFLKGGDVALLELWATLAACEKESLSMPGHVARDPSWVCCRCCCCR